MHSNDFEKAFGDFLDRREYDQAENALFTMVRIAFAAGWSAAGGNPPQPHKIFQLIHKTEIPQSGIETDIGEICLFPRCGSSVCGESEVIQMDEWNEAGQEAMDLFIERALKELAADDEQAKAAISRFMDARERLTDKIDENLTEQESCLLDDYMNELADVNEHEYRYLYIQGIKDCIRFFMKLGLLH